MEAIGTVLSVAQTLFAALKCTELKQFFSMYGYKSELEDLERTVSKINAVFLDAETKQELTHEAQHWIQELKDAVFDADDLFDEFVTLAKQKQLMTGGKLSKRLRQFFSRSQNPFSLAYRMSQGVKNVQKKLDKIATNSEKFGFKINSEPIRKRRPETCSYVNEVDIIGRQDDLDYIVGKLLASNAESVLAIVGMGGLGKTALAQLVYNDPRVTSAFQLRLWTCVADQDKKELDVKDILGKVLASATRKNQDQGTTMDQDQKVLDVKEILSKITAQNQEYSTMESLHREVRGLLSNKRFFLVLDDVWTERRDQWCELVKYLTGGESGSWIVVTTRSQKTADIIGGSIYQLQGLSEDNSWRLFEKTAFGSYQSNHPDELVQIGREIVHGCVCVPLAIRVAGSFLFGQEKNKWQSFQKIGLANIRESENGITPILKLSFDNLETPIKSCFSYCAIFPKDFEMNKEQLICLWMAQGYVVPLDKGQSVEEAAEEYFLILLRRCFFQDIRENNLGKILGFKMHDLMHDIALSVSGKEITHVVPHNISANLDTRVRHVSIASRLGYDENCWGKTHIRSHIFSEGVGLSINFSEGVGLSIKKSSLTAYIVNFKCSRALDLSGLGAESLPSSIGDLLHLRYLDLSKNKEIKVLPKSITKLYNLETLILEKCENLKELPEDLSRFVKLRVLQLWGCMSVTYMPRDIAKLSCLQRLSDFKVSGNIGNSSSWKQLFNGMEDLKALNNLRGEIIIYISLPKNADKNSFNKEDVEREGSYLKGKEHLNLIKFDFKKEEGGGRVDDDEVASRLMEDMHPHPILKKLIVRGYPGVRMPNWITLLPNLVVLYIHNCEELEYLPYLGNLCHLKVFVLLNLKNLEYIEGMESSTKEEQVVSFFPSLERLRFNNLPKLKEWRRIGVEDNSSSNNPPLQQPLLPCLSQLVTHGCPELRFIPLCAKVKDLGHEIQNPSPLISSSCVNKLEDDTASTSGGADILLVPRLRHVILDDAAWLNSLPMETLRCLQNLTICDCSELPNGMEFMTALQTLEIISCRGLKAMPNWMPKLTSLKELRFTWCSESLERRCRKDPPGEDWPTIRFMDPVSD